MSGEPKSDNVVTFRGNAKPEEAQECGEALIYVCSECDCRSWRLMSDGTIECCNCDTILYLDDGENQQAKQQWRKVADTAPTDHTDVPELSDDSVNVRAMGEENFAMRSTLRDIERWQSSGTLVFVGAYKDDGRGVWWLGARDPKARDWMVDKIQGIAEHLKSAAYPPETDENSPQLDFGKGTPANDD